MTAPVTSTTAVHNAILAALRVRFGARLEYGAYEPWDEMADAPGSDFSVPTLLLELDTAEYDGQSDPSGRLAVRCTWIVHCVLTIKTEHLQLTLRQLADAVVSVVMPRDSARLPRRGNLWGLTGAIDLPEAVSSQAGPFTPGLNGRDSRTVRWEQVHYLDEEMPL